MKFGGSSVGKADRILAIGEIVRERLERRPLVVVSALEGVTDLLLGAVDAARRAEREELDRCLADLERRHRWALAGGIESGGTRHSLSLEVDGTFEDLRQHLRSIRILGDQTTKATDAVLAFGETLSSRIIAAILEDRKLPVCWVDAREVMRTDGRFGTAEPDLDATRERAWEVLAPMVERGQVPLIGGFVGRAPDGETTTLGRGGSDVSAAVLGSAMDAEEIQVWTDVDGLMSADPRLVPAARTLARISFAEAAELAGSGARVLHPASVAPAVQREIPLRVLNSLRPDGAGTLIVGDDSSCGTAPLASVASRSRITALRVSSRRMQAAPDFLPAVLAAAAGLELQPDLVLASSAAVTLVASVSAETGRQLERALGDGAQVERLADRALICMVGWGLARDGECRARVLEALAEWQPEVVALGASRTSLSILLPHDQLSAAVRSLHRQFFERDPTS